MDVVHATPLIPLAVSGVVGSETVPCQLDTGGGWSFVSGELVGRVGLRDVGERKVGGGVARVVQIDSASIGDIAIDVSVTPTAVAPSTMFDRTDAKAFLPAKVLAQHHVVFDYPARRFSIVDQTSSSGVPVPTPIAEESKLPRVEVEVAGQRVGMLLDTGASHTMVSEAVFDTWRTSHRDWPIVEAALGTANMGSAGADGHRRMMRIPEMRIGELTIVNVSVVTRPPGTFETYMSSMMTAPIVGALGGNVLSHFRIEIDYTRQRSYFEPDNVRIRPSYVTPIVLMKTREGVRILETTPDASSAGLAGSLLVAVDGESVGRSFADAAARLRSDAPGSLLVTVQTDGGQRDIDLTLVEI